MYIFINNKYIYSHKHANTFSQTRNYSHTYTNTHRHIFIYTYSNYKYPGKHGCVHTWCEALSYIVKNGKWCLREKRILDMFDIKKCDDFSIKTKLPFADKQTIEAEMCVCFHVLVWCF